MSNIGCRFFITLSWFVHHRRRFAIRDTFCSLVMETEMMETDSNNYAAAANLALARSAPVRSLRVECVQF